MVTDESGLYKNLDTEYMHAFVTHSKKKYGRGIIHTNTVEGSTAYLRRVCRACINIVAASIYTAIPLNLIFVIPTANRAVQMTWNGRMPLLLA